MHSIIMNSKDIFDVIHQQKSAQHDCFALEWQ